ncbi:MAG TPA: class I SAM-dependent methyltransferase [Archangium sp.]
MSTSTSSDPRLAAFVARLKKNDARLSTWRRRDDVSCWRAFDRDMPELPIAVDVYGTRAAAPGERAVVVTAWAPRHGGGAGFATLVEACAIEAATRFGAEPAATFTQIREPGRGGEIGHDDVDSSAHALVVDEGRARFALRLGARRDPGLFLDHRTTRRLVADTVGGRRLLNLFAYTGSFSVQAALAGAASTLSVDLSAATCRWAEENLALNGLRGPEHRVIAADALTFLDDNGGAGGMGEGVGERARGMSAGSAAANIPAQFDVIVIDPPSFSKSRRANGTFEVQRDHPRLLEAAIARLAPAGEVWFSCNLREFTFDGAALAGHKNITIDDVTTTTTPPDFRGTPHHCFRLRRTR